MRAFVLPQRRRARDGYVCASEQTLIVTVAIVTP
jgi:hypothetical protein